MLLLFQVLAVLAVVFGVAALLTGRADGLSYEGQDLASTGIPRDRAMTPDDVVGLRFALALRGYRMDEVDDALDRLAAEIAARDEAIATLQRQVGASAQQAEVPEPVTADLPPLTMPEPGEEPPAYVPSDATGELPADTPVDVPTTPEGWDALTGDLPAEADAETPEFVEPPANPFRPEVPEIPTYDPWAVTPRSRYTEGPTYVEVDHDDDADDVVGAVTEYQTGHAPAPAEAEVAEPSTEDGDDDEPPAEPYRPPWQS